DSRKVYTGQMVIRWEKSGDSTYTIAEKLRPELLCYRICTVSAFLPAYHHLTGIYFAAVRSGQLKILYDPVIRARHMDRIVNLHIGRLQICEYFYPVNNCICDPIIIGHAPPLKLIIVLGKPSSAHPLQIIGTA